MIFSKGGKIVKSKRLTAFVLAFLMIFTSFGTMAFAEGGSDISGHWAEGSIQKWVDAGVISGYADGSFKPDKSITRAEFVKIVNGLFGFKVEGAASFTDVAAVAWYAGEVKKAVYEEFVSGYEDGSFRPDNGISRQEAAKIIDTILDMEGTDESALDSFGDKSSVPDWSKNALMYMVQEGYLSGYPDKTLRPTAGITRAETVALLDRVAGTVYSEEGTFGPASGTETIEGNVTVTVDGVTLQNIIINGDLHISAGVGDGDATFEDITVKGETIINGGGMSTVTFTNTNLNGMVISKKDGKVRILVMGDTDIDTTTLLSGAQLEQPGLTGVGFENIKIERVAEGETVILDGDFDDIIIDCPAEVSVTDDSTVGHLTVSENGEGAHVDVEEGSCIEEFEACAESEVTGEGKVESACINCDGVEIEQEVPEVTLGDDVVSVNVGGETVEESTTTPTTSSGGGGGSSRPTTNMKVVSVVKNTDHSYVPGDDATTVAYNIATKTITVGGIIPYQEQSILGHDEGSNLYELKISLENVTQGTAAIKIEGVNTTNTYAGADNWQDGEDYFYHIGAATGPATFIIDNDGDWDTTTDQFTFTVVIADDAVLEGEQTQVAAVSNIRIAEYEGDMSLVFDKPGDETGITAYEGEFSKDGGTTWENSFTCDLEYNNVELWAVAHGMSETTTYNKARVTSCVEEGSDYSEVALEAVINYTFTVDGDAIGFSVEEIAENDYVITLGIVAVENDSFNLEAF